MMKVAIQLRFAKRLRKLRNKFGITQEQLANLSGVDYKHIQLLESKYPPAIKIDTLEKIANAFKITCSKLLSFDD